MHYFLLVYFILNRDLKKGLFCGFQFQSVYEEKLIRKPTNRKIFCFDCFELTFIVQTIMQLNLLQQSFLLIEFNSSSHFIEAN